MKKTLIAIAAIAAMGAASAEVTLYGKLDVGVSSTSKDGTTGQGAQIGSGNYEGSRIGVKGSSEIAGGVKGIFQLEGGLGATDGAFKDFGREAFLGLTGGFGTVSAGKIWTPYDSAFNDALEYNGFSAMGSAFYGGAHGDNGTDGSGAAKNSIQYSTPTMSGFNAVIMYAPNADAADATSASTSYALNAKTGIVEPTVTPAAAATSATNYSGFGLNYANGPLSVNFASEKVLTKTHNSKADAGLYTSAWILAAGYNLGVATVNVGFEGANADVSSGVSQKDAGSSIGLSVPVSKAVTAAIGYATETTTQSGKSDGKTNSTGMQVVYAWNAATAIYAGYRVTDTTAVNDTTSVKATKFATGVRYNF